MALSGIEAENPRGDPRNLPAYPLGLLREDVKSVAKSMPGTTHSMKNWVFLTKC